MSGFKDHFSSVATGYAAFRPDYPAALAAFIAEQCALKNSAWDAGCGSGQFTKLIARHFQKVIGTDASQEQLAQAKPAANIEYRLAKAEGTGLVAHSIDCATVAQAAHWFDLSGYYAEVRRVVKKGGIIALVSYTRPEFARESQAEKLMDEFYRITLAPYWPPERKLVEERYRTLPFPFDEIKTPAFEEQKICDFVAFKGYLATWSAVSQMKKAGRADLFEDFLTKMEKAWGHAAGKIETRWPFFLRIGRV